MKQLETDEKFYTFHWYEDGSFNIYRFKCFRHNLETWEGKPCNYLSGCYEWSYFPNQQYDREHVFRIKQELKNIMVTDSDNVKDGLEFLKSCGQ